MPEGVGSSSTDSAPSDEPVETARPRASGGGLGTLAPSSRRSGRIRWPTTHASPSTIDIVEAFAARGLEPRIEARVTQIGLVEALVGRGVGYGLLMSRPNVLPMSAEGRPVAIRPFDPPVTLSHVVGIWPEDMTLTSRAAALLYYDVEKLGSYGRKMPSEHSRAQTAALPVRGQPSGRP